MLVYIYIFDHTNNYISGKIRKKENYKVIKVMNTIKEETNLEKATRLHMNSKGRKKDNTEDKFNFTTGSCMLFQLRAIAAAATASLYVRTGG